ncbi:hypothetical protein FB567DRAFT_554416 [Paraphoma chrysanthemicola]|uniref:Uncharacterized protein n=1 Tax=Paraphoma chrysanthemicola TaxID=798071 RepID=A0A8K0QV39_9PLEO|nr:hypothetical protein FB567DRAFT_554416 [Paraphoma chrysanthemicola]
MSRVDVYAPAFMGLDTRGKSSDSSRSINAKNSAWFEELYAHSNFSVLGVYLNHSVTLDTGKNGIFKDDDSHWMESLKTLCEQGWGIIFFYVGLLKDDSGSTGPENPIFGPRAWNVKSPSAAVLRQASEAGKQHGKHVKIGISKLLTKHKIDNNGSVVYIDNEYGLLNPAWRRYYNAMFEEMRTPGPKDYQPVRPGLYARDQNGMPNASELQDSNHDLFTWVLEYYDEGIKARRIDKDKVANIPDEVGDNLHINPQWFEMAGRRRTDVSSGRSITRISVGSQCLLNYATKDPSEAEKRAKDPNAKLEAYPRMPTQKLGNLTPQTPWDFDCSHVRDPRYPVASPRITGESAVPLILRGVHEKINKQMRVDLFTGVEWVALAETKIEPDAPILFPNSESVLSIDGNGRIVFSTTSGDLKSWSPWSVVMQPNARPMRRSRAMCAKETTAGALCVFYIATDLSINAIVREKPGAQWLPAAPVLDTQIPIIHAFSNIAAVTNGSSSVSILTISETSHLQLTTFRPAASANAAAFTTNQTLENQKLPPSLFQGTAIVAARPHELSALIFAVTRTHMLAMFSSVPGQAWKRPTIVGRAPNDRLFAHTRLAVHVESPLIIQVAAISYEGDPVVFTIRFDAEVREWKLAEPGSVRMVANPMVFRRVKTGPKNLGPAMTLNRGESDAQLWSINPYGDINFGVDPSGTKLVVLMIPGTGPDTALDVLYRRIGVSNEDWYRRL